MHNPVAVRPDWCDPLLTNELNILIRASSSLISTLKPLGTLVAISEGMNTKTAKPLRVLIVDADPVRRALLVQSLQSKDCLVMERANFAFDLLDGMPQLQPDVIVIDADAPDRDTLENICMISRHQARPIVLFTDDEDTEKMAQAMRAGVTSYVVKGIAPERIKPILQVAVLRFAEHQALRQDLAVAQNQLLERKLIERAKGIVMRQKNISEDAAYNLLRKMAMERNAKLADIASQVVDLAKAFA